MAVCRECGQKVSLFEIDGGRCRSCRSAADEQDRARSVQRDQEQFAAEAAAGQDALQAALLTGDFSAVPEATLEVASGAVIVTTGPDVPYATVTEIIDVISAEAAVGMNIFKDVAVAFRDGFGGRSETLQSELREARRACLRELRREAYLLGADAIIAVDLDYSEFQGSPTGGGMFFMVASGTAVKLSRDARSSDHSLGAQRATLLR